MGRYEQKIKEMNTKKAFKKKKIMIFFLIFIFFSGIMTVDTEYSNMIGYDREMVLGCRRLDTEMIRVFLLGNKIDINNQNVMKTVQDKSRTTINKTKIYMYKIRRKIELIFELNEFNPKGTQPI